MSSRAVLTCVIAGTSLVAAGCGAERPDARAPDPAPAPARAYVTAAHDLFAPAEALAGAIRARGQDPDGPPPDRRGLDALVAEARRALAAFRAVDPGDDGLRFQRERLSRAYRAVVATMPAAVEALADGRPPERLQAAAAPFLDALAALPARAEPGP